MLSLLLLFCISSNFVQRLLLEFLSPRSPVRMPQINHIFEHEPDSGANSLVGRELFQVIKVDIENIGARPFHMGSDGRKQLAEGFKVLFIGRLFRMRLDESDRLITLCVHGAVEELKDALVHDAF